MSFYQKNYLKKVLLLALMVFSGIISGQNLTPSLQKLTNPDNDNYITLLGQLANGSCYTVDVKNDIAYLGNGGYLEIDDVSYPTKPNMLRKVLTPSVVRNVCVDGNYAYVANGTYGLSIIDITNPKKAKLVKTFENGSFAYDLTVHDNYVYIAEGKNGLSIVDVSDPSNPFVKGTFETYKALSVTVNGNYAYIADGSNGIRIINISDPAHPVEVKHFETNGRANNIFVAGDYAYVADVLNGLRIINISDPANPNEVASYSGIHANRVDISYKYAYVTDEWNGLLHILDISNPANPREIGHFDSHDVSGVDALRNYAYISDRKAGLQIIKITDPSNPQLVSNIETGWNSATGIYAKDNYVYLSGGYSGLHIIDVSTKSNPAEIGRFNTTSRSNARDVSVSNNYAYIAGWGDGILTIINISDPANPYETGYYDPGDGSADAETINGNYAYLISGEGGFMTIDISDSVNPVIAGSIYSNLREPSGIALYGNYAYVTDRGFLFNNGGFHIINIGDPSNPLKVGFLSTGDNPRDVTVNGNYAYVANGRSGLWIININDPENPTKAGTFDINNGYADKITVSSKYAYLGVSGKSNSKNSLHIINIADTSNLFEVASTTTGDEIKDIAVVDKYIYVADGEDGLYIFRNDLLTAIGNNKNLSNKFELNQNYPNPFNPTTTIKYTIPTPLNPPFAKGGNTRGVFITLKVYDILGSEVSTLVNKQQSPGNYSVIFDASNLPSGIYYYRLTINKFSQTRKMLLLK